MPRIDGAEPSANRSENPLSNPAPAEAQAATPEQVLRSIRRRLWAEFHTARKAREACPHDHDVVLCSCVLIVAETSAVYLEFVRHPFLHES